MCRFKAGIHAFHCTLHFISILYQAQNYKDELTSKAKLHHVSNAHVDRIDYIACNLSVFYQRPDLSGFQKTFLGG